MQETFRRFVDHLRDAGELVAGAGADVSDPRGSIAEAFAADDVRTAPARAAGCTRPSGYGRIRAAGCA